jgi:hypothetical protein
MAATNLSAIVPKEYGYVLLAVLAAAAQVVTTGMFHVGRARRAAFDEAFWNTTEGKDLNEAHKKEFQASIGHGGYPDMGNGRYSSKLSYGAWYKFNCAQRAHYNLIEMATSIIVFIVVAGFYFPTFAAGCGAFWVVGREIYSFGYISGGANGRMVGAGISDLALLVAFGAAVYGTLGFAGLIPA